MSQAIVEVRNILDPKAKKAIEEKEKQTAEQEAREADKSKFVWVEVPEKDEIFDMNHPGIRINKEYFGPGRHFVDPVKAKEIQERLDAFAKECIRAFQPKKDMRAVRGVAKSFPTVENL